MTTDIDIIEAPAHEETSYVDWPAIIAGIVLATAISILLLTFGSAIGLGFTDFDAPDGASPIWIAIAAASWLLWVQISSFMAGGYLTGRLRRRHHDATEDEVDVRDGAHGLLVWAGALVVGAFLAMGGVGALANAVGSTAATLTNAAATAAGPAAGEAAADMDPNAYFVDLLFRPAPEGETATTEEAVSEPAPATTAPGATAPASTSTFAATPAAPAAASADRDLAPARGEVTRIFAQAGTGDLRDGDRDYLVQLVADETTLTEEEAAARVDNVMAAMDTAKQEAAEAAETARKTGIIGAFLVAASFLVSAIGAFWAAQKGGHHRDKGTVFPGVFRRF